MCTHQVSYARYIPPQYLTQAIRPRIPGRKKRPAHMQFPAPDMKAIVTHKAYLFTILGGAFIMFGASFALCVTLNFHDR
jgi:hypothetical protein